MNKSIWELFTKKAPQNPYKTAITDDFGSYTFQDIVEKTRRIHSFFEKNNMDFTKPILLVFEKRVEWIIAMLAVNKAGGIFINCPTKESQQRFDEIVKTCDIRYIVTDVPTQICFNVKETQKMIDITESKNVKEENSGSIQNDITTIFFTSGTTGTPKGVGISNENILNLVCEKNIVPLNEQTKLLLTGAINFDAVSFEIWGTLLNGGHLFLSENLNITNVTALEAHLKKYKINTLWMTAPLLKVLASTKPDMFFSIHYLISGGDRVSPEAVKNIKAQNPQIKIFNGYGPTECTTFATFYEIDKFDGNQIPLGKPLKNVYIYILDESMNRVKKGEIGELCIAGKGVSPIGYINQNADTKGYKFTEFEGQRIYCSGDFGYVDENDQIVFAGRKDSQTKLNGFRVELSEIESILESCRGSVKAACLKKENQILIFIQIDNYSKVTLNDIYTEFKVLAPYHLQSLKINQIDTIPLKQNGKIDYSILKKLSISSTKDNTTNSENEFDSIESKIRATFFDTMNIIIEDDTESFFDYGLDSLSAIYIAKSLAKSYQIDIESIELFENPSIEELKQLILSKIDKINRKQVKNDENHSKISSDEISNFQMPMYIDFEINSNSTRYNIPITLQFEKKYSLDDMKNYVVEAINLFPNLKRKMYRIGVSVYKTDQSEVKIKDIYIKRKRVLPFNLNKEFPVRFSLLEGVDTNSVFFDFHHIAIDGFGVKEFLICLNRLVKGIPIGDFENKVHQNSIQKVDETNKISYWEDKTDEYFIMQSIPKDYPEKKGVSNSLTFHSKLNINDINQIFDFAKHNRITINETLLIGYSLLMSLVSGSNSVHFYSPSRYDETQQLTPFDMETISVCIISSLDKEEKLSSFVSRFARRYRQDLKHSYNNFPYLLDNKMKAKNVDYRYKADTDSLIAYHAREEMIIDFLNISQDILPENPGQSMFNLNFQLFEKDTHIDCYIEYESELYSSESIEDFFYIFKLLINSLTVENSDIKLKSLFNVYLENLV